MSTNLTKIPTRVIVNGLDVSQAIDIDAPFTIEREAIGFISIPTVSARLTLVGGILGESLNPKINQRWRPGNTVIIQIDIGAGWQSPPFGGTLRIKNSNQYDDGLPQFGGGVRTIDRLNLELVCALGYSEQREPPTRPYETELGSPIPLHEAIRQTLAGKNIPFSPGVGNGSIRTLDIILQKNDQITSLPLFAHQLAWCSPDNARYTYGVYTRADGVASMFAVDLNAAPTLTKTAEELPSPPKFGQLGETEQLAGKIKAESILVYVEPTQNPIEPPIVRYENGVLVYRELRQTTIGLGQLVTRTRKWQIRGELVDDGGSQLIQSADSTEATSYGFGGRPTLIRSVTKQPRSVLLDSASEPDFLLTSEITEETPEYATSGQVRGRQIVYYKAWGLLAKNYGATIPDGLNETSLGLEKIEYDKWEPLGNDQYKHTPSTYHAIVPAQVTTNQSRSGAAYGPPNYGVSPSPWNLNERKIYAEVNLGFSGSSIPRERILLFSNLIPNANALRWVAEIEGALITGRYYAHQLEFNIRDLPSNLPPGYILRVSRLGDPTTSDDYLVSGEELSFHEKLNNKPFSIYRSVGLHLRVHTGGETAPIVEAVPDNWVYENADNVIYQTADNATYHA